MSITQAGDQRWVGTVSNSLRLLQSLYGPFSNVYGIGRISKVPHINVFGESEFNTTHRSDFWLELNLILFRWLRSVGESRGKGGRQRINRLKLERFSSLTEVRRSPGFSTCSATLYSLKCVFTDVDFVTPLCSQVVYEGLVDDIFRIKCGEYE